MGMIADIQRGVAELVVGQLDDAARRRLAALHAAVGVKPDDDVYDRIRMARYILTGSEDAPPVTEIRNAAGEVLAVYPDGEQGYDAIRRERPTQNEDYPFASGDVLVLGPEIFAGFEEGNPNLPRPDAPGVVINWRGVNFVRQELEETEEPQTLTGVVPPKPDLVGPDPEFGPVSDEDQTDEVAGATPTVAEVAGEREPAPSAGNRWLGRRGGSPA